MTGSIQRIYTMESGRKVILLSDQTTLELTEDDVEMLQLAFESECQACGFDPNEDEFEVSADDIDEDEEEDDGELPGVR